jgi:hypothetical protein
MQQLCLPNGCEPIADIIFSVADNLLELPPALL